MREIIGMLNAKIKPLSIEYDRDYDLPWLVLHDASVISQHRTAQGAYDWSRTFGQSWLRDKKERKQQ